MLDREYRPENDFERMGITKAELWEEYLKAKESAKTNPDYYQIARAIYLFWSTGVFHCVCCCKPGEFCVYAEP